LIFRNKMAHFSKKKIAPPRDRHNDIAASSESEHLAQRWTISDCASQKSSSTLPRRRRSTLNPKALFRAEAGSVAVQTGKFALGRLRTASSSAGENRVPSGPDRRIDSSRTRGYADRCVDPEKWSQARRRLIFPASNRDAELPSRASDLELRTRAEPCWVLPI
jgi:hypothetical protein